jgi:hypothetical protein
MKIIKQPLIDTLLREGITPPKRASLKKLAEMLCTQGWHVEIKISMTKTTTETRKKEQAHA